MLYIKWTNLCYFTKKKQEARVMLHKYIKNQFVNKLFWQHKQAAKVSTDD